MDDADRVEVVVVAVATAVLTIPAATTTIIVADTDEGCSCYYEVILFVLIEVSHFTVKHEDNG